MNIHIFWVDYCRWKQGKTMLLLKCCCLFGFREQQDEPGAAAVVSCRTNINKGKYMSSSSKLIFLWRQVFAAIAVDSSPFKAERHLNCRKWNMLLCRCMLWRTHYNALFYVWVRLFLLFFLEFWKRIILLCWKCEILRNIIIYNIIFDNNENNNNNIICKIRCGWEYLIWNATQ